MIRIMVWIPHKEAREVQMDCGRGVVPMDIYKIFPKVPFQCFHSA